MMSKERINIPSLVAAILMLLLLTSCSGNANQDIAANSADGTEVSGNQTDVPSEGQIDTLSENAEQDDIPREDSQGQTETEEDAAVYFTMEEVKALGLPEEMLAYWLVLNSKMPFVSNDEGGQEFYWNKYFFSFGGLTDDWLEMPWDDKMRFHIADMNNDGKNEIIISYAGITRLLYYEDGRVYKYQTTEQSMSSIYENGIFAQYAGGGYEAFCQFTELSKDGYTFDILAMKRGGDGYYEVGGISVSEAEYSEFCRTLSGIECIEYTEESLDKYLLAGLSEEELYMVRHAAAEPMTDTVEYPMEPEIMQAYYEVLTSEKEFISVTDDCRKFYLEDYQQAFGGYDENYQILYFSIADMDWDGNYEVVLTFLPGGTQILHYEDGNVYSYQFKYYEEIGAMTSQGIFDIDHYANDGFGRITSFDEDGCDFEEVDYDGALHDDRIRYFDFSEDLIERYFRQ